MSRALTAVLIALCLAAPLRADGPIPPRTSAAAAKTSPSGPARKAPVSGSSWWTTIGSLVAVIGLIVLVAKLVRKHSPASAGALPREVFHSLGRRSLDFRHSVQVVRVGSRLLVLAVSPDGVRTLAEITDPVEVDYLAGLCERTESAAGGPGFGRLFQTFSRETTPAADLDPAAVRLRNRLQQDDAGGSGESRDLPPIKEAG